MDLNYRNRWNRHFRVIIEFSILIKSIEIYKMSEKINKFFKSRKNVKGRTGDTLKQSKLEDIGKKAELLELNRIEMEIK